MHHEIAENPNASSTIRAALRRSRWNRGRRKTIVAGRDAHHELRFVRHASPATPATSRAQP
jgi:hypothetical protein